MACGLVEGGWRESKPKKNPRFGVDAFASALIRPKGGASASPDARLYRYASNNGEYEAIQPQNVKVPMRHANRHVNGIDALLGQDELLCTLDQALAIQAILDGIYNSSASGREVRIRAR